MCEVDPDSRDGGTSLIGDDVASSAEWAFDEQTADLVSPAGGAAMVSPSAPATLANVAVAAGGQSHVDCNVVEPLGATRTPVGVGAVSVELFCVTLVIVSLQVPKLRHKRRIAEDSEPDVPMVQQKASKPAAEVSALCSW